MAFFRSSASLICARKAVAAHREGAEAVSALCFSHDSAAPLGRLRSASGLAFVFAFDATKSASRWSSPQRARYSSYVPGKSRGPLRRELEDARRDAGDEPAIVGDEDHGALEGLERRGERADGLEIEVVGGLVEDEDVGLVGEQAAEHQARGLAARRAIPRASHVVAGEEHPSELAPHERGPLVGQTSHT